MSVVAVKISSDTIRMAADSQYTQGGSKHTDLEATKMWRLNDMIIGCVGCAEESSLMWHFSHNHKPLGGSEKDMMDFVLEFKEYAKKYGVNNLNNEYLIALLDHKKVYLVEGFFITEITTSFAIGSGASAARAALYLDNYPRKAVQVACEINLYCHGPVISESYSWKESK